MTQVPKPRNTIRTYAVVVVSITSAFVIFMCIWLTNILAAPEWCGRALGADRATPGNSLEGLKACINLMGDQVGALAWNSHIFAATIALCLLVLMVIVIAGGHVSFKADKTGLSGDIGGDVTQVKVVNPPSDPVPTTEAPKPE
jgi:hypothetical protein